MPAMFPRIKSTQRKTRAIAGFMERTHCIQGMPLLHEIALSNLFSFLMHGNLAILVKVTKEMAYFNDSFQLLYDL